MKSNPSRLLIRHWRTGGKSRESRSAAVRGGFGKREWGPLQIPIDMMHTHPDPRLRYYRRVPLRLPISPTFSGRVRLRVCACVRISASKKKKKKKTTAYTRTNYRLYTNKHTFFFGAKHWMPRSNLNINLDKTKERHLEDY